MMRNFVILLFIALAFSCNRKTQEEIIDPEAALRDSIHKVQMMQFGKAMMTASERIRFIIENRQPDERYRAYGKDLYSSVLLPKLYVDNYFKPLWISRYDSLDNVFQLRDFIEDIKFHGLFPEDYHFEEVNALCDSLKSDSSYVFDGAFLAQMDLLLSDAYFMLASHLYHGKIDKENMEIQWGIRRDKPNLPLDKNLISLLPKKNIAEGFKQYYPPHPGYQFMVEEVRNLYPCIKDDFQVKVDKKFTSIKPGDSLGLITDIKNKLIFWNLLELDTISTSEVYDEKAVEAVKKLQVQFGFNADGVIGSNTIAALNMPVQERINKLCVNMERLRWMPDSLEQRYIFVNIADFSLQLFEGKDTLISMRTIVGKSYRKTPVFNATITYLVFSPSWTIPPGIKKADVIPSVKKNIDYLKENNMRVLDAQGKQVDPTTVNWQTQGMKYTIRQAPGAKNALGKVKFMFPNKHNVYLHDTPTRGLFARDKRTFSSSYIHIEKPLELANILLDDIPEWTEEKIREAMNSGRERTVVLKTKVGVYLYYLTAWGSKDGLLHYRYDIYERDNEVMQALKLKPTKFYVNKFDFEPLVKNQTKNQYDNLKDILCSNMKGWE